MRTAMRAPTHKHTSLQERASMQTRAHILFRLVEFLFGVHMRHFSFQVQCLLIEKMQHAVFFLLFMYAVEVPAGGGSVVDPSALHINLLPFSSSLSLYHLYESLQRLFTVSMTPAEQRFAAMSAPLGQIVTQDNCGPIRPGIALMPDNDVAVVQFGGGQCGKVAAASFLKAQADPNVRRFIREEIFEVSAEQCAPYATDGAFRGAGRPLSDFAFSNHKCETCC